MGSPAIASFVPHLVFWGLIAWGLASGALNRVATLAMAAAWLALPYALAYVPDGSALFSPLVAVLDIVLVFVVFKRDVRLF